MQAFLDHCHYHHIENSHGKLVLVQVIRLIKNLAGLTLTFLLLIFKCSAVQELIYELKIKLIRLGEKKTIITEISKKQRQLLKKFNIKSPDKADLVTRTWGF